MKNPKKMEDSWFYRLLKNECRFWSVFFLIILLFGWATKAHGSEKSEKITTPLSYQKLGELYREDISFFGHEYAKPRHLARIKANREAQIIEVLRKNGMPKLKAQKITDEIIKIQRGEK